MTSNDYITNEVFLVRNETESWMMTYEYEQRDATSRVTIAMAITVTMLLALFGPASVKAVGISLFVMVAATNLVWLIWRMFYDNENTRTIYRLTVIADQALLVLGASTLILICAADPDISFSERLTGWALYFAVGFQICDAARSTPWLAFLGGILHAAVTLITWRFADPDQFLVAGGIFIAADLYAIIHSVTRLDQVKAHARLSIEQAMSRDIGERQRRSA